jgi:hypothetical protein
MVTRRIKEQSEKDLNVELEANIKAAMRLDPQYSNFERPSITDRTEDVTPGQSAQGFSHNIAVYTTRKKTNVNRV